MTVKNTAPWSDAVKKEARGNNDLDLGEVQDTGTYYVHTQKGIGTKTQFYIPKTLFKNYDGRTVHFDVSAADANQFVGTKYPSDNEYRAKYDTQVRQPTSAAQSSTSDIIERIPIMTERLDVSKHMHEEEVTITKTPYRETQTREIPVTHEEIRVEEVPASRSTKIPEMKTDMTEETIRVPLRHEDVDVKRTPEVREELIIHKTPVTESRRISEDVRSEKFKVTDNTKTTIEDEKKKRPV